MIEAARHRRNDGGRELQERVCLRTSPTVEVRGRAELQKVSDTPLLFEQEYFYEKSGLAPPSDLENVPPEKLLSMQKSCVRRDTRDTVSRRVGRAADATTDATRYD